MQYEIGQLFGCAYGKAASCNIAFNGFCKAGIHPLNRDVFDETNFLPAGVSDRPIEENNTVFNTSGKDIAASAPLTTNSFAPSTTDSSAPSTSASCVPLTSASSTPSTSDSSTPSTYASSAPSTSASSANNSSTLLLSVEQINPLPKKSFQSVTKKERPQNPLLTGSPHKKFVQLNSAKTTETFTKKASSNIGPRQKTEKRKQLPPKTFVFKPV